MLSIETKTENDISVSLNGVPLREDYGGCFVIGKENMSKIPLMEFPEYVRFTTDCEHGKYTRYNFHREKRNTVEIHFEIMITSDSTNESMPFPMFTRLMISSVLNMEEITSFETVFNEEHVIITIPLMITTDQIGKVMEKAENMIKEFETKFNNTLDGCISFLKAVGGKE